MVLTPQLLGGGQPPFDLHRPKPGHPGAGAAGPVIAQRVDDGDCVGCDAQGPPTKAAQILVGLILDGQPEGIG